MVGPFELSVGVASLSMALSMAVGLGIALVLVRKPFRWSWLVEGMVMLPLVLPPTVLGYYLLVVLGQRGIGAVVERLLGFSFVFSWQGAVVAGFVVALPVVVQTLKPALQQVSREIEDSARVDGCSEVQVLLRITLPLMRSALISAAILAFLRTLGEFGATLMVAGNIPGRTQTLAMAVYDAIQAGNFELASQLALLMFAITFGFLFITLLLNRQDAG